MKTILTAMIFALGIVSAPIFAAKPCDELKQEIGAKLEAKGVKAYSLDVVKSEDVKTDAGSVVGSCDGGSQRIVYTRAKSEVAAPAQPAASS